MKIKKPFSFSHRRKTYCISFLLICGILLNTYADLSNTKLFDFLADIPATVSVNNTKKPIKKEIAPIVDFTFTNDGTCSGEEIQFTSIVTGTGDLTYSWDFGDGETSDEENPIHTFEALGSATSTFDVILTVTDDTGSESTPAKTITVKQKPDVIFEDADGVGFTKCDNTLSGSADYTITVKNSSSLAVLDLVTNISVDWGDGSAKVASATFPITHTYTTVGSYPMKITANGTNGCKNEKTYTVSNSSNLVGGFNLADIDGTCAPVNYKFEILSWGENSDDTEYIVDFGDGNTRTFTHATLKTSRFYNASNPKNSTNFPVSYAYLKGSCPLPSGQYTATLTIRNACFSRDFTISNIKILETSKPNFDAIIRSCIDEPVSFENTTEILDNPGCLDEAKFTWDFGDSTTPTITTRKTTEDHTYTNPGTYTVSLTVQGSCDAETFTKEIEILPKPIITNTDLTQEICSTQSTAEINLTADIPGTTFSWTTTASSTDITGFTASGTGNTIPTEPLTNASDVVGTVTYTVTPFSDICEGEPVDFVITVNPAAVITDQPDGSEVCLNGDATLLEVTAKNGTGIPTYEWFSNTTDLTTGGTRVGTDPTYQPLADTAGTLYYYVEITFPSGVCTKITSATAKVVVVPQIIIDPVTAPQTICIGGTTELKATYTNGTGTPSYQWFSNTTNTNTGGTEVAVTTDGTYTPTAYTTVGDFYYYVEISLNGDGCSANTSDVFKITVVPAPTIDTQPIVTQEICQGGTPTDLTVSALGGTTTDKTYQWYKNTSNNNTGGTLITGATSATYTPVTTTAGTFYYYLIVSQTESGCSVTSNTSELNINPTPTITAQPISFTICLGDSATPLKVTESSLTGSFQWYSNTRNENFGGAIISGETSDSYVPPVDVSGTIYYYAEITFPLGSCSSDVTSNTASVVVNETPEITIVSTQDISCFGDTTGKIVISVAKGVPDYSYNWTTTDGSGLDLSKKTAQDALTAGTYNVTVTDNLGCTATESITIVELSTEIKVDIAKTDIDPCSGANFGTIDLTVTGGKAPYRISWSNLATGASIKDLPADTYIATIKDKNDCEEIVTVEITQSNFSISPVITQITCEGENNGSISLNLMGDLDDVTVTWSDTTGVGIDRVGLSPGTYTVNIKDSNPAHCEINETFIIENPTKIIVTETITNDTDCNTVGNGSIVLTVHGGKSPYTYKWSTGETTSTSDRTNLIAGDYTVEITDANTCTIIKEFNIFRQEPILINLDETQITDCGLATVSHTTIPRISGGISPYTYEWSDGTVSDKFTTTISGTYTLKITDAKGCTKDATFDVNIPITGETDFSYTSSTLDSYNLLSIHDPIQFQFVNISSGTYASISWDFGDGSPIVREENPSYTYDKAGVFKVSLKVIYGTDCAITKEYDLNITKGYAIINPTAFTPNSDGYNDTIRPSYRGLTEIEMTIYNNWGIAIYTEKNTSLELTGWDGTIKGVPAQNGNYIMVVKGLTFYNKEITSSTPITLIK